MNDCIFCEIVAKRAPAYCVYEDDLCLAFLDKHPKTRGHLQLIPKKHYRWVYDLPEIGQFFTTAQRLIRGILPVLKADHATISAFGLEVKHAHVWIVPQYKNEEKLIAEGGKIQSKEEEILEVWQLLRGLHC